MPRHLAPLACAALALAAVSLPAGLADAKGPKKSKPRVTFDAGSPNHPSFRYGALSAADCTAELGRRGIEFKKVDQAPGVLAPVRLPKDVGGVTYRTQIAPHLRDQSPFDVFDCRLVLALSDFSKILQAHDIDEVLMFSAWRPPPKTWPEGKLGTRHPGALAIDAMRFGKKLTEGQLPKDRVWLDVEAGWSGSIGAPVCGSGAAPPRPMSSPRPSRAARGKASPPAPPPNAPVELRAIVCEAVDQHLFTTILTPNYNRPHRNHFHLEVTPNVTWHLVR